MKFVLLVCVLAAVVAASADSPTEASTAYAPMDLPSIDALHSRLRTLNVYVAYNKAVEAAMAAREGEEDVDLLAIERAVITTRLAELYALEQGNVSGERSTDEERFMDFTDGLLKGMQELRLGELTKCMKDLYNFSKDMYDLYVSWEKSTPLTFKLFEPALHDFAKATLDCLEALGLEDCAICKVIEDIAHVVDEALDIYEHCSAFVDDFEDLGSDRPHLFKLGEDLAGCLGAISALALKREVGEEARVRPDGWTCSATFFATRDGCDVGCGRFDPDCVDPLDNGKVFVHGARSVVPRAAVPDGWTCAPLFYGTGECDRGCGVEDPDCEGVDESEGVEWERAFAPQEAEEARAGDSDSDSDAAPIAVGVVAGVFGIAAVVFGFLWMRARGMLAASTQNV